MAFNGFPGFSRKTPIPESVGEKYPNTAAIRVNQEAISKNVERSETIFDKKFKREMRRMFETREDGKYSQNIEIGLLTEAEIADIKNFIGFAAKRLAAGALISDVFHKDVWKGKTAGALDNWAPPRNIGHDSMHAMIAYVRSKGASLIPAYMKTETSLASFAKRRSELQESDDPALLEEDYVVAFGNFEQLREFILKTKAATGLDGEELVLATVDEWHRNNPQKAYMLDPDYAIKHQLPEFTSIIRNIHADMEQGRKDPNLPVHEFQRLLAPLLARLRTSPDADLEPVFS